MLAELVATARAYGKESHATLTVLNHATNETALATKAVPLRGNAKFAPLVYDVNSRAIDKLRGVDIAAGWAQDTFEMSNILSLGAHFERVRAMGIESNSCGRNVTRRQDKIDVY